MAVLLGGHLVDRDTGAMVGAVGLSGMAAREKTGHGPGVIAAAVAQSTRRVERETTQDEDIVLDRPKWLEDRRQLESGSQRRSRGVQAAMCTPLGT